MRRILAPHRMRCVIRFPEMQVGNKTLSGAGPFASGQKGTCRDKPSCQPHVRGQPSSSPFGRRVGDCNQLCRPYGCL